MFIYGRQAQAMMARKSFTPPTLDFLHEKEAIVAVSPSDFMFRAEFCGSAVHSSHGNTA